MLSLDNETLQEEYFLSFYESLDCARSLTCAILLRYNEYEQLVNLDFDPMVCKSFSDARDTLAATKFLSKAEFLQIDNIDKKKVALDKFREAEAQCKETNVRISRYRFSNPYTLSILSRMARKIEFVLGDFAPDEFIDACNWGPGATTLLPRRRATYPEKFSVERRITAEGYDFVKPWFHLAFPHWEMTFEIDGLAKIITVPKNAKTDRTIAIEPGLNLFFQKGIGAMISKRLKWEGVDLNDQRHNQRLSRLGSKFGRIATVDFSSASDTIASRLVQEVFPPRWFGLMDAFRSRFGRISSEEVVTYSKFSSMGNGFTFEMESLLFYTMAFAVCEYLGLETNELSVFGDDVILPVDAYDLFAEVSADLGFTVNLKKSYSYSSYRESCGAHWWNGLDIKPIFQKEVLNGKASLLKAANNVRRYAHSRNDFGCDRRLLRCWHVLVNYLGVETPRISDGYGDIGLIENIDGPGVVLLSNSHGWEGNFVRVWALQAVKRKFDGPGLLLTKLKAVGSSLSDHSSYLRSDIKLSDGASIGNDLPLPGRTKLSKIRVFIPRWRDLGPWVY